MPEQFEFDFTPATTKEELKKVRDEYRSVFFVVPAYNLNITAIKNALAEPEKERKRLQLESDERARRLALEREEDQAEANRVHPHSYNPNRAGNSSHSH